MPEGGSFCGGSSRPTKLRPVLLTAAFCCCCLLTKTRTGEALRVTKLVVPLIVDPRLERVGLRCEYDLEGAPLYSVKWYKNDFEFYRYRPDKKPPGQALPVAGVSIDVERCDSEMVTLLAEEGHDIAGTYGCEISTDRPDFAVVYKEANMSVAALPKRDPILEGVRASYEIGEILEAECISAPSYPQAVLTFLLNDKEVSRSLTREIGRPEDQGRNGVAETISSHLTVSSLGLKLRLDRAHFPGGSLSIACQSTLPGISVARARKTEATSTLAANNQRLAQEPPAAGSATRIRGVRSNFLLLCCFVCTVTASILRLGLAASFSSLLSRGGEHIR